MNRTLNDVVADYIASGETMQEALVSVFGDYLDTATRDNLYKVFMFYETPAKNFEHNLQNKILIISDQYKEYVRLEAVEWQPLVTRYIDKEFTKSGENSKKSTPGVKETMQVTNGGSDGRSHSSTSQLSGTDLVTVDNTQTMGGEDTSTTDRQVIDGGHEDYEHGRSTTRTGGENTTRTASTERLGSENISSNSNDKALSAATPPIAPIDLQSFTQFDSGVNAETMSGTESNTTTTYNGRKDNVSETSGTTYNSIKDSESGTDITRFNKTVDDDATTTTEYGRTVTDDGTTSTQYGKKDTISGTESTTYGKTTTTVKSKTGEDSDSGTYSDEGDDNERGYIGIPAEILTAARTYISQTNAFMWLVKQITPMFVTVYEW